MEIFADELEFYDLGADIIDKFRADEGLSSDCAGDEQLPELPRGHFRRAVWLLFEYPESSSAARAVAILSVSVILLSIATFCLETLPQFKQYRLVRRPAATATTTADDDNGTSTPTPSGDQNGVVAIVEEDDIPAFDEPLFVIETICVVWFTSEVAVRFAAAPDHLAFFRSLMNVIDVLSIVPYFITLSAIIADATSENLMSSVASNQVLVMVDSAEKKLTFDSPVFTVRSDWIARNPCNRTQNRAMRNLRFRNHHCSLEQPAPRHLICDGPSHEFLVFRTNNQNDIWA